MKYKSVLLCGLLCALTTASMAQWVWIDGAGHKVYSDSAPPPGTPEKNIVRQPGARPNPNPVLVTASTPASPPPAAASGASAPRPAGKSKELEEKRKQAEQAEAERRKAEEDKQKAVMADNCRRARQAKAGLDTGLRVARSNDKGEREFLDETQRAAEIRRLEDVIRTQCQ